MKEDAIAYFRGNIKYNLEHYLDKNNSWVLNTNYDKGNPLALFKKEFPEINLDMSEQNPAATDYKNVQILYDGMKKLTDSQATDPRFWTGLAHSTFWEYMKYRCNFNHESLKEQKIMNNYFFKFGKRSLFLNPLARLWWVGRQIYDKDAKNPYEGLECLKVDFPTKVLLLFSHNFCNNKKIIKALLLAIKRIEDSGIKVGREVYVELTKYLNIIGGKIILDYLSQDELIDKIITHYCKKYKVEKKDILKSKEV